MYYLYISSDKKRSKQSMKSVKMELYMIDPEALRVEPCSEYNRREWNKKIDRRLSMQKYGPVFFYKEDGKEEYWVEYTCEEGIRLLQQFDYHTMLLGRGFASVEIMPGEVIVTYYGPNADQLISDCDENRVIMAYNSRKFGTIYTKYF